MKIQGLIEPSFDEKSCPLTIDDANNIYHFSTNDTPYRSEVSSSSAFVYGIESFKQSIKEIPFGVQANIGGLLQKAGKTIQEYFPDGVDIFNGAVNVKIGDKLVEGGKLLSRTANRNLDVMRERYKKESPRLESAQQKVAFDFGSQGANWTSMLLAGPYSPFLMAGLTMTGETQERLEKWKETHGTVEGYEERQGEDSVWNVANAFVQGTIEKYLGSWAQVKAVKKGWGYVKAIGKNAIQEGFVEEPLQDVTDFYFDKLSGLSEDETLRDRMFGSLRGYVVASIFGGAGGYSAALYHRSIGIETYKDVMKGTLPEQDLEKAATKAYEQDAKTMRDIITVELESSSSLQAKRGEVYESLYKAALEQVKVAKEQGGFPELQTEEDIANYVKSVADRFADETLAEANRRNTVIEEVLDPSLIRYENGQLVMPMTKGTEGFDADKIMAERTTEFSYDEILHKLRFEEMRAEEEQRLTDMLDVEKQRLAPLFDTARGVVEELENEYGLVNELTDLSDAITERKMSFKEARDALGESFPEEQLADLGDEIKLKDGVKGNSAEIGFEYLTNRVFDRYDELRAKAQNYRLLQESLDIANQNAELDANNPAYEGETININGVERTVYNSNGDRIAMSEPALRNFYKWFGDSKVVDKKGRPLVVYHGTKGSFDVFRRGDIGYHVGTKGQARTRVGRGKDVIIMPLYLNIRNLIRTSYDFGDWEADVDFIEKLEADRIITREDAIFLKSKHFGDSWRGPNSTDAITVKEFLMSKGYDGIVYSNSYEGKGDSYIAFNPNQIKSTSNRGTYSKSDNIYHQTEDGKDLVVSHATTLDKLEEALELGAMPMPSLAVTKAEYAGKSNFGEIVFVGGSDIVDPNRDVRNKTFTADIYSTRKVSPTFEITKEGVEYITRQTGNISKQGSYYWVANISYDLERGSDNHLREIYLASKGKITDLDASTYSIVQSMTEKEKADFSVWKRKFINEYTDKKIFEGFAPSGNRKFSPYDLKNILRIMQKQNLKGSESISGGNAHALRGIWAKELKSIEEIRKEKGRIVNEQIYQEMDNVIWDETTKLSDLLVSEKQAEELEASWIAPDEYMINEALSHIKPNSNIQKILEKADLRSDKKAVDAVKRYMQLVNELPVKYFESKPQRAVDFSEFAGVIMPESPEYDNVAKEMEDRGLLVLRTPDYVDAMSEFEDIFFQKGVGREKGSIQFKGDRALITLTEEANSSTLAHELAHYWLQNTFLYSKSGLATPEYKQFFNSIAKYLDITDDQETIKEWQQEKWARAAEMYAMGKAPEGMEKPLTQYQQWIRKAYGEVSEPMYIDENGEAKVPEFDFETMKMFANLAGETLTEPEFKQKQEAVRGLAKSTNQMAQAKGMKTELPTYEKRSATDMGKKADEFIQRDKQLAIDIVKGLKPEQEGLFRQDLFAALRELALNEGDSDLLNELSKSMTVEEATELGQRIQALARGRIDPVKQMVELRDERMKKNKVDKKKLKEETEKAKKEIKQEMAEASTPKEWADFIKSLEC